MIKNRGVGVTFNFLKNFSPNPPVMTITNLKKTIRKLMDFVYGGALDLQFRSRPEDFTRTRLLPFHRVASLVLAGMKRTLDLELKVVFELLDLPDCPTNSAYTQARHKLLADFFVKWLNRQTELVYECRHETFKGYRLIAVDGSMVFIPDNPETRKAYPPVSNNGEPMQARVLCCHDVLNNHAVDTRLGPSTRDEVDMALDCLGSFGKRHILIYDRHFAGWALIRIHQLRGIPFIIRCKVGFNKVVKAFVKSGAQDAVVQFKATERAVKRLLGMGIPAKIGNPLTVRLIRVDIGTDEPEILVTSLMDEVEFPHEAFKGLYFKRWKVETLFDRLKNKFQLEIFSGKSVQSVQQDFHAMVFLANLQSMMERANRPQVQEATQHRQHDYQINWNKNLGLLKPMVTTLFGGGDSTKALKNLLTEMAKTRFLEPIRNGRKIPRSKKRKQMRTKHRHSPNYKRAG